MRALGECAVLVPRRALIGSLGFLPRVRTMIIHARKAILKGLSAAANRSVPPLHYEVVHRLARDFPDMRFSLNGGITTLGEAARHLPGRPGHDDDAFGKDAGHQGRGAQVLEPKSEDDAYFTSTDE